MKSFLLVLSLLLALLVALAGYSAHHGLHSRPPAAHGRWLAPPRVVRSPAVARQHRLVRTVEEIKNGRVQR